MKLLETDGATRRAILTTGLAASTALSTALPAAAGTSARDLASQAGRLKTYMQMRGALDGQLVIGFITGRYYGIIDEVMTPMFGVVAATFARYRLRTDGGYYGASFEVPYFTDLHTGAALDHWANPLTGETVPVPEPHFAPSKLVIEPDLRISVPETPPGMAVDGGVVSAFQSGADIWMSEETRTTFTIPGVAKPVRYSEIVTLHALQPDFGSGNVSRVPTQTGYSSVSSWRAWQKMGEHAGSLLGTGAGRYGVSIADLPPAWIAATAARRPELLNDPGQQLAGLI